MERSREIERAKSAGWESDEDEDEPSGYLEDHQPQEAVSVEVIESVPEDDAEPYDGDGVDGSGGGEEAYGEQIYENEDREGQLALEGDV